MHRNHKHSNSILNLRHLLLYLAVIFYFININLGCKKADNINGELIEEIGIKKDFFLLPKEIDEEIIKLSGKIKELDEKTPFVSKLSDEYGMPVWGKIIKKDLVSNDFTSATTNKSDSNGIYIIPLIQDTSKNKTVSSVLLVKSETSKLKFFVMRKHEYKKFAKNSNGGIPTSTDVMMLFLTLDEEVFGHNKYEITDKKAFSSLKEKIAKNGEDTTRNLVISFGKRLNAASSIVQIGRDAAACATSCRTVVHNGNKGNLVGVAPGGTSDYYYIEETTCVEVCFYINTWGWVPPQSPDIIPVQQGGQASGESTTPACIDCNSQQTGYTYVGESRIVNNITYTPTSYPGIDHNLPWLWWEQMDSDLPGIASQEEISNTMVRLYDYYYQNQELFDQPFRNMSYSDWDTYLVSNNSNAAIFPIIPLLVKIIENFGINAAADFVIQVFMGYVTNENYDISQAFRNVDKTQVIRSGIEGLFSFKDKGTRVIKAAGSAILDVLFNAYNDDNYTGQEFIVDFAGGFTSAFIGGELAELSTKYSLGKIGKGLVTKFNFSYPNVCKWLGGGVEAISKSYSHTYVDNGIQKTIDISSIRLIKGWSPGKIAVIGRSQKERVDPFANQLSNELGFPVLTWHGFDSQLDELTNVANNKVWIKSLKDQGYTVYDIGLDPFHVSLGRLEEGPYYSMELDELFRN